jgi:hypothetical protein
MTGGHAITAYVEPTSDEVSAVLSPYPGSTALADIILLLGLFTGRDVFVEDGAVDGVIIADPRESRRVGPFGARFHEDQDVTRIDHADVGFELALNRVYSWIRSEEWQRLYRTGDFILMAKSALQPNHSRQLDR